MLTPSTPPLRRRRALAPRRARAHAVVPLTVPLARALVVPPPRPSLSPR
jgi:hypothetical protein